MITKETSFVTSLKPIMNAPYFTVKPHESIATLILQYWQALERVFPESFQFPNSYVIQKTPGLFSLHSLAPEVFELARNQGMVNVESLYAILSQLGKVPGGSEYWNSTNLEGAAQYGSMKGFTRSGNAFT